MNGKLTHSEVESKIIMLRETKVILDSDVAALYGVETKRVNEAVKNNPDRFPEGYILYLNTEEWNTMKSKFSSSLSAGGIVKLSKAIIEKVLHLLETIFKSTPPAHSINEALVRFYEFTRNLITINTTQYKEK